MSALLLALACTSTEPGTTLGTTDQGTLTGTDGTPTTDTYETTVPTGATLFGTVPDQPIPPPTFVATNRDGSPRSQPDLIGHPTVIWFYPAANTGG